MVQKRETKAINKLCVREILSLSFVWQICAESREDTYAHRVFHACRCLCCNDKHVNSYIADSAVLRALASRQCGLGSIVARCHIWVEFVVGSRFA